MCVKFEVGILTKNVLLSRLKISLKLSALMFYTLAVVPKFLISLVFTNPK